MALFLALAGGAVAESPPRPRPPDLRPIPPEGEVFLPGWTLRAAENSPPVAVVDGPGAVRSVALFCLSGEPFFALFPKDPAKAETARLDLMFGKTGFHGEPRREETAGGAYVLALRDTPLADLMTGDSAYADLALDGVDQGLLSLAGSSALIRRALESCEPL